MFKSLLNGVVVIAMMTLTAVPAAADEALEALQEGQVIADFRTENLYDNEAGQAMGARFRHVPSGFVLDMLRIQSVPQAFMWVNSPPPSDQGEPHTCEHLLLGKGTKGRYVASLEDMSLGHSSAFTRQLETCYHFNTSAGTDVFFDLLEAKLDAMLNPTFSDEEIRREVCNVGVTVNASDSTLEVEEKGTVYSEMVSSYERPWSPLFRELGLLQYGQDHPLSLESGGLPAAIRTMEPEHLWAFHRETHHLNNMCMIMALADDIPLEEALRTTSEILARVEPDARPADDPATAHYRQPPPQPYPEEAIRLVGFPHQNPDEPGNLMFSWRPTRTLNNTELTLLELLLSNLAGDETSNLYRKFIDSQTRIRDLGASDIYSWVGEDLGYPVYVGFQGVKREMLTETEIAKIRREILDEFAAVAGWADDSDELQEFNERVESLIIETRRDNRKFLNTPPQFGTRGTGSDWMTYLWRVNNRTGFRRSLLFNDELAAVEELISSGKNFWTEYITKLQILDPAPYAVAAVPDPDLVARSEQERAARLEAFVESLKEKYAAADDQEAIRRYQEEYDAATAVIDEEAATIAMPSFVDTPPLTLDDQLRYVEEQLPGGGPLVSSKFENMTAATVGVAFRMNVVPEPQLVYVPALPTLLTDVGVIQDGQPIAYDEMKEAIRREISELSAFYSVNYRTERVELVLRTAGSDGNEAKKGIDWINAALFAPDWRSENIPRLRDAIDLAIARSRNTIRGPEEYWVQDPANAYWRQHNPLILSADCFLTQTHALHRLRWRLKDAELDNDREMFAAFMNGMADFAENASRDELNMLCSHLIDPNTEGTIPEIIQPHLSTVPTLSKGVQELIKEAAEDLRQALAEIPDANLVKDWRYLCRQMASDLAVSSATVLADLNAVMNLIRRADNVRAFVIGSTQTQDALRPGLDAIVARLSKEPSQTQSYRNNPSIVERLRERTPDLGRPIYVGLVNENTRSGVHINSAPCASFETADPETLAKFLSARLYGGGGAHSMFMKTWGAGLAYSNGLRSNESTGRLTYYAERCPDLAQTMQFVVDQLKNAPYDTSLAEYAIAQAFSSYRAGNEYEQRGEAMAADLADGLTPDVVRRFRRGVLALRDSRDLYGNLHNRMEYTYGEVLPGYGPAGTDTPGAIYFVIGPEKQFQSYEEYLHTAEGEAVVLHRLYPRDYWLTGAVN
jgi:Zn-dependent M16 (insulinase) family peptidase